MYIVGGIAIHGSEDVPPYPASHGCIRIPMYASNRLPGMIPVGTPVLVYGCQEEVASIP
jgi:lipoprotein-anchoring transpeptidase ErfK/SrfK